MKRKIIAAVLSFVFIGAFWFLGVDRSWFVEQCPDCYLTRDIIQIRICSIPITQTTREHETLLSVIARDLGAECTHPKLVRWHKQRYWGLLIVGHPNINGIYAIGGSHDWYDENAREILRQMVRDNPSIQGEFRQRVFMQHDREYWNAFVEQLKKKKV